MTSFLNRLFNYDNDQSENRATAKISFQNDPIHHQGMIHVSIIAIGRVQGVGFRYGVKHLADLMDIDGIVRNESDGTVYIEAIATENLISKFIQEIAKGPTPSAIVDKLKVTYLEDSEDHQSFEIVY